MFSDNESSDSASIKEEENSPGDPGVEASPENLTGLVCHVKFIFSPKIEENISQTDLDGLFTQHQPNEKYFGSQIIRLNTGLEERHTILAILICAME